MNKKALGAVAAAAAGAAYLLAPGAEPAGHLYVMRGLFGGAGFEFSRGVDVAADKAAKAYNLSTTVKSWRSSAGMCELAAAQYKKDRKPVFVLGHSLGGNEVSDVAHCLKAKGVPVAFAFYYDPTPFVACVPDNVKFATSWRRSFANITVQTRHTVLDDLPSVHAATLKRIGIVMEAK
jgi:hypothetical protein